MTGQLPTLVVQGLALDGGLCLPWLVGSKVAVMLLSFPWLPQLPLPALRSILLLMEWCDAETDLA